LCLRRLPSLSVPHPFAVLCERVGPYELRFHSRLPSAGGVPVFACKPSADTERAPQTRCHPDRSGGIRGCLLTARLRSNLDYLTRWEIRKACGERTDSCSICVITTIRRAIQGRIPESLLFEIHPHRKQSCPLGLEGYTGFRLLYLYPMGVRNRTCRSSGCHQPHRKKQL
jgi:hypothetical protein